MGLGSTLRAHFFAACAGDPELARRRFVEFGISVLESHPLAQQADLRGALQAVGDELGLESRGENLADERAEVCWAEMKRLERDAGGIVTPETAVLRMFFCLYRLDVVSFPEIGEKIDLFEEMWRISLSPWFAQGNAPN